MSELAKLTGKQRLFVEAYLDCLNATEAARRAGYAEPNKQGPRLLVNVGVRPFIEAGLRERTLPKDEILARLTAHARGDMGDFLRVDEEEINLSWSLIAAPIVTDENGQVEVDTGGLAMKLATQDHDVKPTDRILHTVTVKRASARLDLLAAGDAGKLGLIKKYTLDDKGKVTIELYDAQAALVKLGEAYGIFRDRIADNLDIIATAAQSLDAKLSPPVGAGSPDGVSPGPDADRESDPQP